MRVLLENSIFATASSHGIVGVLGLFWFACIHVRVWLYIQRCLRGCTWWFCVYYSHGEHSCCVNYGMGF